LDHEAHHPPARGFGLSQWLNNNHGSECPMKIMLKHVGPTNIGKKMSQLNLNQDQTIENHKLVRLQQQMSQP
jgi:hypothetical protein